MDQKQANDLEWNRVQNSYKDETAENEWSIKQDSTQSLEIYGHWLAYKGKKGIFIVWVTPASLQAWFKSNAEYTTLVKIQEKKKY